VKRSLFLGCLLVCSNVAVAVALPDDSGKISVSVPEHVEAVVEVSKPATKNWFTTSSLEDAGKSYFGVGVMKGNGSETHEGGVTKEDTKLDTTAMSLKYGWIGKSANRAEFDLTSFSANKASGSNLYGNQQKMNFYALNFNYLVTIGGNKRFLPYIGAGIGVTTDSNADWNLGVSAGILFGLTAGLELEIAYKALRTSMAYDKNEYGTLTVYNPYAGLNYKF
jgi:opacity protein-like surface antigen